MKKVLSIVLVLVMVLAFAGCGNHSNTSSKILVEGDAYTLADGESISIWKFPNDNKKIFTLRNGTELLAINIVGPENHIEGDAMLFENLEKNVQDSILTFYNEQGAMFDVNEYLEQAYTEYTEMEDKTQFRCYYLTQESFVSEIDDEVVCCTTSGILPVNCESYKNYSVVQAFDRKTGALLSN